MMPQPTQTEPKSAEVSGISGTVGVSDAIAPQAPAKLPLRGKVFVALFCLLLGLAFPVFNLFSKQLSMDNHENRFLTGLPDVLAAPLGQMPRLLDAFFVDNSPFRYQLVVLNAGIDYILFGTSQNDQVLPGRDGWLFYKDGPCAAQPVATYQGLPGINDDEATLAAAAAGLQRLSDRLAANGCTLVLDITPSKDRIYREYLPAAYPLVNEENRTDRFVAYLRQATTVPITYSYEAQRAQALTEPNLPLYFKTDTHWNHAGALLQLDSILQTAGLDTLPYGEYQFAPDGMQTGDMANVAALYPFLPEEQDYYPTNYDGAFAVDGRTVGVVGDSFSEYYMRYLSQRFADNWRQALETLSPALADDPGCQLLILEGNERSVTTLETLFAQF